MHSAFKKIYLLIQMQSPQLPGPSRKVSQQPQNLSTLVEVSESRSSTISRPSNPPGLPPPPPFSPAPPPQVRNL